MISAIVGLDTRATLDLDTTVKGFDLSEKSIHTAFEDICSIDVEDDVSFHIIGITEIRENDDYPGLRISLKAEYPPISVPLSVDVTTGDAITPFEIEFTYQLMYDNRCINVMAYNRETVIAEKLETILTRNIANTRIRDFYDIYILRKFEVNPYNKDVLRCALEQTMKKRGSLVALSKSQEIIDMICKSERLCHLWERYCDEFEYARGIAFESICNEIKGIVEEIKEKTD